MELNFSDDFLSKKEHQIVLNYCLNADYRYGETDDLDTPKTGMTHNIPETEFVYKLFKKKLSDSVPELQGRKLYRMYVNCFAPNENPYFHKDGETGITFLYYPNEEWDIQDGGETQFYIDGNLYGIVPQPNRLVVFPANILHRATTFRSDHRFTVAIKYQ